MEKPYRDLFDRLSLEAAAVPALAELVSNVGQVDDLDPLRIPALKAMKRSAAPPLRLAYRFDDSPASALALYARNPARKRLAPQPALCARLAVPSWLFDASAEFPGADWAQRGAYVELVARSFFYLELRIAHYFEVHRDNTLGMCRDPRLVLEITPVSAAAAMAECVSQDG